MPSKPSSRALMAMGKTPLTGCNVPSRLSSPISKKRDRRPPSSRITSVAASMAMANGKS